MYTQEMLDSIKNVERTRSERLHATLRRMEADEKDKLLQEYHPDYRTTGFKNILVGPNKGQKAPSELTDLLQAHSRLTGKHIDLEVVDYDVDVLIIGGGGAGSSAAIEADRAGAKVLQVTKLRMGDANTMMAEGGIQGADKENDSPAIHYLDALGGGHFSNRPELLSRLVHDGPLAIKWLSDLGVMFDKKPDGTMITTHGGGTSRKRMHAAADYSGAEIMRVVRDEVQNRGITTIDFAPAIELILDEEGKASGAVLMNFDTGEYSVVRAKTVIIATGGAGRLHYQGFPTSNHYGATADGLILGYPSQIFGALVTEKVRSLGAQLINRDGIAFMNPLETRDVAAASIIRECSTNKEGIPALDGGSAVWLDTPMIEDLHGEGTIEKGIPGMLRMYAKFGIDLRKQPILVYPTLHYQNGGLLIHPDGETTNVKNLFVAGEAVGGIHGKNRLMGNSLLDIIVFGRIAGKSAAARAKETKTGKLTLAHVEKFEKSLADAGVETDKVSPLLLPSYTHGRAPRKS